MAIAALGLVPTRPSCRDRSPWANRTATAELALPDLEVGEQKDRHAVPRRILLALHHTVTARMSPDPMERLSIM